MALPSEISEGDTLELTLGGLATESGTVSVSQTIDPGETLSDVATSLVADLSGLTNDAGDPLGLSGEVVTVDDGFGGVQTSLQITSTDGISLGSVELSHLEDLPVTQSTVQTDEFVATLEIPTDAEVSGFTGGAELEVSISGGGLSAPVSFSFTAGGFTTAQDLAQSLQSQITSQISGQQPDSELFVEVATDATSESGVSLVLRSAEAPITTDLDFESTLFGEPGSQSFTTVALPSEISEGDTLELTLGGLATESGTVSVSQTIDPGETLSDVATSLVADLSGLTNDAGDPLGLSGEVVTVDDGFGGVQTSLQITSTDGISLGSVELSHLEDLPVTQSTVQTDEFVATLEIPTDAEVSGFTGGAELEVSISGGGLSAPVSFSFTAGGFTTAQDLAQSLQSQITSQISGQQPDSELFVEVATDATSESGVSLVLRSAEAPITTDLDFESTLFGEPGSQSFTTVALPSEISEGDTLELTLGGLATESGTVSVSQTIDPGETLSDVATSLVADLSGLTNDAGDPLGLSGEVVTVDDGFGGVQTSLQITSTDGISLGSVELSHLEDLPVTQSTVQTDEFVATLEIPTDAEVSGFTGGAELEVSISGGGLSAPVSFSFTAGGFTTAQDLAQSLQSQITSQISGQQPDSELFVEVATDATSESGVSLVLRSAEAPITTDLDFESTLFGEPGSQSFTTVALPSEISEGDTLELTLGGLATESGTVSVSQTIDPGETLSDVATSLVADLSGLTNDAGDPLGLSGEVVTVDDGFGGVQTSLQITSTDGISLGSVELSHLEDLPVTQSTVQTDEFVATLEIPTDAEVSGFTGGAELEVSISGGGLSAPVSFSFTAGGFTTAQDLAQSLQSQITSQISGQQPDSELFVEVATDATSESGVSLVLRSAEAPITTDLDFESTLFGEPGSQSFTTVALPSEISEGDTLELTLGGLATESGTVSVSQTIDPGETLSDVATSLVADLSGLTNDAGDPLGLSGEVVTVDDGFGGVQTSLQITSTDGISLGSVELSHLEDLPVTQSTVQTDEFVATLEIPTDAEVSGFTGGAELEVSISGGGLSAPVSFSFTAGGFTTAQDLAQSLQSQITSQISGQQPDSELFVEVATDATSESGVSLVLRSAEAPITTDLDFESTLFGEPGSQSFTTVALPSEISEGDTLELTLGGLATESGTVSVSQTIDPGETLSDVATSLVADLSGLTNDAGDPLGLSGEVVTVDDGFGGVQTSLQITSTDGISLGSVELSHLEDLPVTQSTVQTDEFVATLEIPTDAEVSGFTGGAELEVSISGGGLSAPVSFSFTAGGFTTAQDLAQSLQSQITSQISGQQPDSELFVEVATDATSESGVSLVLRSAEAPITTDLDFESTLFGEPGSQSFTTGAAV